MSDVQKWFEKREREKKMYSIIKDFFMALFFIILLWSFLLSIKIIFI
jgi:hypothetical protein